MRRRVNLAPPTKTYLCLKKDYEKQYPSVKNNYYNENLDFMSNLRSVFFYTDDTIY